MWGPTGRLTPAGTDCQPELRTVPRVGLASVSRRRLLEPRSGYPWAGFRFGVGVFRREPRRVDRDLFVRAIAA
jgi:hypothetical protein